MDKIVDVKQINKSYKKRKTKEYIHAVKDISFYVPRGEILDLLGLNGDGKTTTIKILCCLLIPDSGSIYVNGVNMKKMG